MSYEENALAEQGSGDTTPADVRARRIARGLFPHQVEGVAFLLGRRRALLADDMGLGKTRQAIVALRVHASEGPYLDWVPANHWQAEDRAYRIGQTRTVNVSYLIALGTIDEFVRDVLEAKTLLAEAVVDGRAIGGLRLPRRVQPRAAVEGRPREGRRPCRVPGSAVSRLQLGQAYTLHG